jgi:hypothetical protein
MSGEPFAQLFEQLARLREQAAANVAEYEKGTQVAQEKLNWLVSHPELSPPERNAVVEWVATKFSAAREELAALSDKAGSLSQMLALVDPAEPEHVALVATDAELLDELAKGARAIEAMMRLVQEVQRRAGTGGDA